MQHRERTAWLVSTPHRFFGTSVPHKIQGTVSTSRGYGNSAGLGCVCAQWFGRKRCRSKGVPRYDKWTYSPNVWRNNDRANLNGNHVDNRFNENAMPVFRECLSR